jgi:ABC-type lipoprotein release transport system permease subunit
MIFKLAWRNIWRNRKRTFITASSIFFAVVFSSLLLSLQYGGWGRMIDNVINYYVGYGQIHESGYHEDPSINRLMDYTEDFQAVSGKVKHLNNLVPRLESFALASYGTQTRGVMVSGIDPALEDGMTHLSERLTQGEYIEADDKAALVAEGLAEQLKVGLGDSLILISQGYHGVNAAGKYPIKGILHFSPPDLNKSMVYLSLPESQYFFGTTDKISSLVLHIDDKKNLPAIRSGLDDQLDMSSLELIQWEELVPGLVGAMNAKLNGTYMFMIILYAIITFGIFGTILMMLKEREYEFGILIAIGMNRKKLGLIVWLESIMIGLVGAFIGILGAMPLVYYLKVNPLDMSNMGEDMMEMYDNMGVEPIFPTAFDLTIFLNQALLVFMITALLGFFALWKIRKLQLIQALQN